jgi:hypothetical protein
MALVICLMASMAGCTSTTREWDEEVQLSDGTVLEVHRTIRFEKASGAIGQAGGDSWICDGETLSFVDPGTGRVIKWTGHRRTAALLERLDEQYVIVAAQTRCEFEDRDQPLWIAHVLTPAGWEARSTTILVSNRTPNLALDSRGYSKTEGWSRLTLASKRDLDEASRIGQSQRKIDLDDPTKCH